jgi:hypothetical protein
MIEEYEEIARNAGNLHGPRRAEGHRLRTRFDVLFDRLRCRLFEASPPLRAWFRGDLSLTKAPPRSQNLFLSIYFREKRKKI